VPKEYTFRSIYDCPRRRYSRKREKAKWCSGSFLKRPAAGRRAANQKNGRAAAPTPIFDRIKRAGPIQGMPASNMKTPRDFEKLSTSAGLLILGAGFVSLGALSFINRHLEDAESGLLLNTAYPIIGSLVSILLGFSFVAIALLFMATRLKEEKAPRKAGRARDPEPNPLVKVLSITPLARAMSTGSGLGSHSVNMKPLESDWCWSATEMICESTPKAHLGLEPSSGYPGLRFRSSEKKSACGCKTQDGLCPF
jgi:hypothetical protein